MRLNSIRHALTGIFLFSVFVWCGEFSFAWSDVSQTADSAVLQKTAGFSQEEGSQSSHKVNPADSTYLLQVGDHIRIKIYPEDEYLRGGEMEISTEGNVTLPLIGKVHIAEQTAIQAEQAISKILAADYLVDPEVVIEITTRQVTKYSVLILGQVKKPGSYEFPEDNKKLTLLHAISLAGGFSELANIKKVRIVRKSNGQSEVIRANAEAILNGQESDIELKPGDTVNISESLF